MEWLFFTAYFMTPAFIEPFVVFLLRNPLEESRQSPLSFHFIKHKFMERNIKYTPDSVMAVPFPEGGGEAFRE